MNKYPLIGGSILAVVLLVLASLTNVVGFQTVQSSTVSGSPLFSMRTQRANNQQQNSITFHYLGEGKGTLLQFPTRDSRIELLKKSIEIISKMDDKKFERFTELCIQRIRQNNTFSEANPNEIAQILRQCRTKPETIINSFVSGNNYNITSSNLVTICHWLPGCIPLRILIHLIEEIITFILFTWLLVTVLISCLYTCGGHCEP
jgi:hypothetical protein